MYNVPLFVAGPNTSATKVHRLDGTTSVELYENKFRSKVSWLLLLKFVEFPKPNQKTLVPPQETIPAFVPCEPLDLSHAVMVMLVLIKFNAGTEILVSAPLN